LESQANVGGLVHEYRSLLAAASAEAKESFEGLLVSEGDWTPNAADHLVQLAQQYGAFMLRNALAIALALEIEDGDLGF
jgi:hypothetical protein